VSRKDKGDLKDKGKRRKDLSKDKGKGIKELRKDEGERIKDKCIERGKEKGIEDKRGRIVFVARVRDHVRRKDVFVDRRTSVSVIPVRDKTGWSSFLAELPRFENSRNVEMTTFRRVYLTSARLFQGLEAVHRSPACA